MRIITVLAAAAALLLLAGCYVQSAYPLYTEDNLTFDPGLVGTWADPEEPDEPVTFEAAGENVYKMTLIDSEEMAEYEGRLVQIGELLFLDLFPAQTRRQECNDDFIPLHMLLRIQRDGDELKAAEIDEKWLSEKIDSKEISISHFRYDGRLILTAGTDELQQAVNGLAGMEGAFAELQVLRRVK